MPYQCFQDGKPCSEYKIPGWTKDTFETKREAEIFCFYWAVPVSMEDAIANAFPMDLCVPVDYSICEVPVMMEIREILP